MLIVLRPGLSAQPLTGTPAKPTISVRFKDGIADVQQEEIVAMMLAHPAFNADFICADNISDPYAASRQSSEPAHVLTELKYGTPVHREVVGAKPQLTPEMSQLVKSMAADLAKEMLPGLVQDTLKQLVKTHEEEKASSGVKVKGKRGRKPKIATAEVEPVSPIVAENPVMKESTS